MAEDNDSTDKGSTGDDAQLETYRDLLERGILDDQHREIADKIFGQEDFTLLVLHIHLLIEKALNKRLAEKGVPRVLLLGKDGLEFHQKYDAYKQLYHGDAGKQTMSDVLNALRDNIAHDFWDPSDCVRDAFKRVFGKKRDRAFLDRVASTPEDAVKLLYVMLGYEVGVLARPRNVSPRAV